MSTRSRREAEVARVRPAQPRSTHRAVAGATERRLAGAMEVPIDQVVPDPAQPRQDWSFDGGEQRLAELAESIQEFGVLQPLLVREEGTLPDGRQRYVVIAGGRRLAAAMQAGQSTLPVVVRGEEAARIRVVQLIENLQRQQLSVLDEARAFQELMDLENLSAPMLAGRLHVSAQHVRDRLRVLADQVLADAVERRQISASAAREISKLPTDAVMGFRERIVAGERLQINDVASVRARLAAEGIINPRLKRGTDKQTMFVPAEPQRAHPALGDSLPESGERAAAAGQPDGAGSDPAPMAEAAQAAPLVTESERASAGDTLERPSTAPEPAPVVLAEEQRAVAARLVDALDGGLRGKRRASVAAMLGQQRSDEEAQAVWWLVYEGLRARLGVAAEQAPGESAAARD